MLPGWLAGWLPGMAGRGPLLRASPTPPPSPIPTTHLPTHIPLAELAGGAAELASSPDALEAVGWALGLPSLDPGEASRHLQALGAQGLDLGAVAPGFEAAQRLGAPPTPALGGGGGGGGGPPPCEVQPWSDAASLHRFPHYARVVGGGGD